MLLMLVSLLCCVPAAKACLQCDRSIRLRDANFILQKASTPFIKSDLGQIRNNAYRRYRETARNLKGIIDLTTFYRVKTEYQSEFDRFLTRPLVGTLQMGTVTIMEEGRQILERHLDIFISQELCPNRCGVLRRRLLDCISCRYRTHVCPSPDAKQHCATTVLTMEGDQAMLNCSQPWHRLLMGRTEYHFTWSSYLPGYGTLNESDFKVLVVTDDSSVILNQVHAKDRGTYRCSLQGQSGTVFYRVDFRLAVHPWPDPTHRPVITLPSLPLVESQSPPQPLKLVPVIATVTALSLAASVVLAVVLRMMMSQRRAAEEERRWRMEG